MATRGHLYVFIGACGLLWVCLCHVLFCLVSCVLLVIYYWFCCSTCVCLVTLFVCSLFIPLVFSVLCWFVVLHCFHGCCQFIQVTPFCLLAVLCSSFLLGFFHPTMGLLYSRHVGCILGFVRSSFVLFLIFVNKYPCSISSGCYCVILTHRDTNDLG